MNNREISFFKQYKKNTGVSLVYEPASFLIQVNGSKFKYTPDFYDPKSLWFYEVVGSRQAFQQNKFKIEAFQRAYPQLKFRLVTPDGSDHIHTGLSYRNEQPIPTSSIPQSQELRAEIGTKLSDYVIKSGKSLKEVGTYLRMSSAQMMHITDGSTRMPHIKTATAIQRYLNRQSMEES